MAETMKFDAIGHMLASVEKKDRSSGGSKSRSAALAAASSQATATKTIKTWKALPGRKAALAAAKAAKKIKDDQKERGQEGDYLAARREKKRLQDMKARGAIAVCAIITFRCVSRFSLPLPCIHYSRTGRC